METAVTLQGLAEQIRALGVTAKAVKITKYQTDSSYVGSLFWQRRIELKMAAIFYPIADLRSAAVVQRFATGGFCDLQAADPPPIGANSALIGDFVTVDRKIIFKLLYLNEFTMHFYKPFTA